MKAAVAEAALDYIEFGDVIGVGTGSTVNYFIEKLAKIKGRIDGAVSSSEASTQLLKKIGIPVFDLNTTGDLRIYIDGADECDKNLDASRDSMEVVCLKRERINMRRYRSQPTGQYCRLTRQASPRPA